MKIISYSVLAATLVGGTVVTSLPGRSRLSTTASLAQEASPSKTTSGPNTPGQGLDDLPAGTLVYAEFPNSLDAKKAKPGDTVVVRTTLAVITQGRVAIPNDGKIIGHVTEAVPLKGTDGRSRLGIIFDHVALKDGKKASISLVIQAIGMRTLTRDGEALGEPVNTEMYPAQPHPSSPASKPSSGQAPHDPIPHSLPQAELAKTTPALDAGSHGVIGMPDLSLVESRERGAVIESAKKTVKLDSGTEIVLRVIAAADEETTKP